ncbi:MAG: leucyl aminopeptidase family protein [Pseudomonadota bacterium]
MTEQTETTAPTPAASSASDDRPGTIPLQLVEAEGLGAALGALPERDRAWAEAHGFAAKLGQSLMLPSDSGGLARVLVGWGSEQERRRERFHLGRFARTAPAGTYRLETPLSPPDAEEAALGWLLARYAYDRYRSRASESEAHLIAPDGIDRQRLGLIAEGVFITRDLINTPANDMGPAALEHAARRIADRHGAETTAIKGDDLLDANLPMIHTVGRAAAQDPRLIDIRWGAADAPLVTIVGKGVCFDTGGLNLKPGGSMGLMKKDMGGAASALGLAHMIMALGLSLRLRVLIPAVENTVSAGSFRPGDVLRSRKGLTVEVNNTDAEGRLILADALTLASEEAPELILDLATLTGAARVALGPDLVPFYTADNRLAQDLTAASVAVADPLWRMPLWPAYEAEIEPDIADLDNAPSGGMAGSITAALFLQRFVDQKAWAHFDIYGWTPKPRPGRPKGGEAQAIRAIIALLETRYPAGRAAADA